jgi:hypothetical protein
LFGFNGLPEVLEVIFFYQSTEILSSVFPYNVYKTARAKLPGINHVNIKQVEILVYTFNKGRGLQAAIFLQQIKFLIGYITQIVPGPKRKPHFVGETVFYKLLLGTKA